MREAAAVLLRAPADVPFPDHFALLQLSRDVAGKDKVSIGQPDGFVSDTTVQVKYAEIAFAAGLGDGDSSVAGHISKPAIARGVFETGIKICRQEARPTFGADFGDAQLRAGWASRYIEDRMRLGPLVLIG